MGAPPPPAAFSLSFDSALHPVLLPLRRPSLSLLRACYRSRSRRLLRPSASAFQSPPLTPSPLPIFGPADFSYARDLAGGSLLVRPMVNAELGATVQLLADSFAESLCVPRRYVPFLEVLVRQYLEERLALAPDATVLVGFYRETGGGEGQMACTAEVSLGARGANPAPPTPTPPRDCPYICNMAVSKPLRRRGIGWHLLKACEELITQMKALPLVYLHCRLMDSGPFSMYKKAGYKIVETDSILVWLSLQRRKHLMFKELHASNGCQSDTSDDHHPG